MVNMRHIGFKELRSLLLTISHDAFSNAESDWEACFSAQALCHAGVKGSCRRVVQQLLRVQQTDGLVPSVTRQPDFAAARKTYHCKPFLCQTLIYEWQTQNTPAVQYAPLIPSLLRYLRYYERHRRRQDGFYQWSTIAESGINSNIDIYHIDPSDASDNYQFVNNLDDQVIPVDLNSYLVAEFGAFSRLCEMCGDLHLAAEYRTKSEDLAHSINQRLWNPSIDLYCNISKRTGLFTHMRSWTGLLPVLLNFASPTMADLAVNHNLLNETQFWRTFGVSSLSEADALYSQAVQCSDRGKMVDNWCGPMWLLPNVLTVRYLNTSKIWHYDACDLSRRVLECMCLDLETVGVLHANYDADTGRGLSHPGFSSWNLLALELLPLAEESKRAA